LMAGRVARGERWAFDDARIELAVRVGGRLEYLERFAIRPSTSSPRSRWVLGDHDYLATAIVYDETLAAGARDAFKTALAPGAWGEVTAAVDEPSPHLFVFRVLAKSGPAFREAQRRTIGALFELRGRPVPDFRKI